MQFHMCACTICSALFPGFQGFLRSWTTHSHSSHNALHSPSVEATGYLPIMALNSSTMSSCGIKKTTTENKMAPLWMNEHKLTPSPGYYSSTVNRLVICSFHCPFSRFHTPFLDFSLFPQANTVYMYCSTLYLLFQLFNTW